MPAKFDKFEITTYDDYLTAMTNSTTGMFWAVWSDVEVVEDFEYNYYVPKYEQHIPHVFKNGEYFDGVCLFSVHEKVSEKEFKYRFFNEKKEIDYVASYPKPYDIFTIETYDQYLEAMSNSSTDMFWMTSPNVKIADDFKFDTYFTHDDVYNRNMNRISVIENFITPEEAALLIAEQNNPSETNPYPEYYAKRYGGTAFPYNKTVNRRLCPKDIE